MFRPETKILLVDDMPSMRKMVRKAMASMGFTNMEEAENGADAWEKIHAANPPFELVISDWTMPQSSGIDLLKRVRRDGRFAKLPFVMLTAEAEAALVKEALMAGASNYIVKPFTAEIIKQKLEQTYARLAPKAS